MRVVIVGNGAAGVAAALRLRERQPNWRITLLSGESRYHWSRPAMMYVFMGHMRYRDTKPFPDRFWCDRRIDLLRGWVRDVDVDRKRLALHDGTSVPWDRLLIATGSKPNRFGWPGQDLRGVQGLYGLQDLRSLYRNLERTRSAVVVGGGLIGIELAEMLLSRNVPVTLLVREESYWNKVLPPEESAMVNRVILEHGLRLELNTELASIEPDRSGRAAAAIAKDGRQFECQLVGLTVGVRPNVEFLASSSIRVERGVVVDRQLRTDVPDVWAAGDCAEIAADGGGRNTIQQVWYTAKKQGELAGDNIAGASREYEPGIWFNSAKFFDLEYQTYGKVNMKLEGERNLYWEHPDRRRSARIVYTDEAVVGLQSIGIRWRHEVAERWLYQRRPVMDVIERLREIAFDPELQHRHEPAIARSFREQLS